MLPGSWASRRLVAVASTLRACDGTLPSHVTLVITPGGQMTEAKKEPFWRQVWPLVRPRLWPITWRLLLVLALVGLFGLIWWKVPPTLYRNSGSGEDAQLKAITDTRTGLLAGLIGLGALLTFWLNSRVYRITAETLRVTEQGQITERFTKAIEQLGSDKLNVRLGGIYGLERIAVDSERDHPTVVEVLSAFVREQSQPATQPSLDAADANGEPAKPSPTPRSPTDVQAAVTVLGRLPRRRDVSRGDLRGAYLEGAYLQGAHLEGAILYGTHLEEAYLQGAHLEEAILYGTHLEGADLRNAHLEGVDLRHAHGLIQEQIDPAILDKETQLPTELRAPTSATPPQPAGEQHERG
jgi:Pentapeptide repeats (8 copies)